MLRYLRPLLYSLVLCGLLAYASLWIRHTPAQVEARLEATLGGVLGLPVRVEGCEERLFTGRLRVGEVLVPAAPAIEGRTLLVLKRVEAERDVVHGSLGALGGVVEGIQVSVEEAALSLECRREGPLGAGAGRRWNFEDLLRSGRLFEGGGALPAAIRAERLLVSLTAFGEAESRHAWRWDAREALIERLPAGGFSLALLLDAGAHWGEGRCELHWLADGSLRLKADIHDLADLEPWLPLLSEAHRGILRKLRPRGAVDLDLDDCVLAAGRLASFHAIVHNYGSAWEVGALPVEVSHLRGPVEVAADTVRMGRGKGDLTGTIWGLPIRLDGEISAVAGEIGLTMVEGQEDAVRPRPPAEARTGAGTGTGTFGFSSLLPPLRLRGVGQDGRVTVSLAEDGRSQGALRFRDVTSEAVPAFRGGRCAVSFEAAAAHGSAEVRLEGFPCEGIGSLHGGITLTWSAGALSARFADLEVRHASGMSDEPRAAVEAKGSVAGTFTASLAAPGEPLQLACDLAWLGLPLRTALLAADGVAGSFEKKAVEETGRGSLRLGATVVPTSLLGEELRFGEGRAEFHAAGDGLRLSSLLLRGEERALRARGTVALDGGIDILLVLAHAAEHAFRAEGLDGAEPAAWKDAAGESFRAFHVSGELSRAAVRELPPRDPIFVRAQ